MDIRPIAGPRNLPNAAPKLIEELARAKVNLTLEVSGKRPDGYHELSSLVAFADVGDRLLVTPADVWSLSCSGPMALAIDGPNIVDRTAAAFAKAWPGARTGHCTLHKALPVFAGIGGGSADAAAALRALQQLNTATPGGAEIDWLALARSLGADVPVCLGSQLSLMQGAGERVQMFGRPHALAAVLVNPGVAVSTAAVFSQLAAPPVDPARGMERCQEPATTGALLAMIQASRNDLEAPAIRLAPVIGEVLASLAATPGCQHARMSGSGSTCFGLFDTATAAAAAADEIANDRPDWWVRATVLS